MRLRHQLGRGHLRWVLSLFGILLLLSLGPIQAFHVHPGPAGQSEDAHCVLCQVAHATPHLVLAITFFTLALTHLSVVLFEPSLRSVNFHSSLFSRPPPAIA